MAAETISVTFFNDFGATAKRQESMTLEGLGELIRTTTAPSKERLPWLKLARFGDLPSEKGCLRWDGNVIHCSGAEGDYDAGEISFEEAVETAEKAGLLSIVYTSPSHCPERPRWRICCPTAKELPPAQRAHMVGRINGLYHGIFAAESWALSQSYYYGSVNNNPAHQVAVIDGQPVDELDELDEIWIGKPHTKSAGNGADTTQGPVDEEHLLEQIRTGASYHTPAIRLLGAWANRGVSLVEARKRLTAAFNDVFPLDRDARWHSRVDEIPQMLEYVWGKEAQERDAQEAEIEAAVESEFEIHDAGDIDLDPIPPREWVLGTRYCLGFVSASLGDGGVGKTALAFAEALSIATKISLTGEHIFRRENILIICLEDDIKEIKRRIKAAILHHRIDPDMVKGHLFYCAHKGEKLVVNSVRGGPPLAGRLGSMIRAAIQKYNTKVVIIDPLVKAHGVDENSNIDMDAVIDALVTIATEENVAIMLSHHTRKGSSEPGNADIGRGATAVKNGARLVYTTIRMTSDEQKKFGLTEEQALALIRVDSAKVNICTATLARWFKLTGVKIDNANDIYPNGDEVQTVAPWIPPDLFFGLSTVKINEILDRIELGLPDGGRYSDNNAAKTRAAWRVVCELAPDKTESQARQIINTWKNNGVLISKLYHDSKRGEDIMGLFVDDTKRAGAR